MPPRDTALARLIAAVCVIPPEQRAFDYDLKRARIELGVTDDLARHMLEMGLPAVASASSTTVSFADLHFLALRLGCARLFLLAARRWAETWRRVRQTDTRCAIRISLRDRPDPATSDIWIHTGSGPVAAVPDDRGVVGLIEHETQHLRTASFAEDEALRQLRPILTKLESLELYFLPDPLVRDTDFALASGLCECRTAAQLLMDAGVAAGLEMRTRSGLLLSDPMSTPHVWCEVRSADRWISLDPLMLATIRRFGGLNAREARSDQNFEPMLVPLRHGDAPFLYDAAGRALAGTYFTEWVTT